MKKNKFTLIQKKAFDIKKNRYKNKLIINPPFHTKLEIKEILDKIPNKKHQIVDFGCGTGRLTIPLLQNNFNVKAVDISTQSIKQLRKNAKNLNLIIKSYSSNFGNNKYYIIVGADILHHTKIKNSLEIIFNHLKSKGLVIFSEPGAFNLSWYLYLPITVGWNIEKGMTQCNYFNLKRMFIKNNFINIKIQGLGLFPRSLLNWSKSLCKFNDYLGNLPILRLFAYRYIIYAEKS